MNGKVTAAVFKYLGSMFDPEGGTTTDCKNRVLLAWNKWREVIGVICEKKVPVKLKHIICKTVIRPTMTYNNNNNGRNGSCLTWLATS